MESKNNFRKTHPSSPTDSFVRRRSNGLNSLLTRPNATFVPSSNCSCFSLFSSADVIGLASFITLVIAFFQNEESLQGSCFKNFKSPKTSCKELIIGVPVTHLWDQTHVRNRKHKLTMATESIIKSDRRILPSSLSIYCTTSF